MKANLLILMNANLLDAAAAIRQATGENVVPLCRDYLSLLSKCRDELYLLRGTPEVCLQQSTILEREAVEQTRKAIRASLEKIAEERGETESLLRSLTNISGYEATATFNRLAYRGFDNWELKSDGVRSPDDGIDRHLSIEEAVAAAGNLRREAYAAHKTIF